MTSFATRGMVVLNTVLSGAMVGFLITKHRLQENLHSAAEERNRALEYLREENGRLTDDLNRISGPPTRDVPAPSGRSTDSLSLMREAAHVVRTGLLGPGMWPGKDPNEAISGFAAFAGASEAEKAALTEAVEGARRRVAELAVANAKIHRAGNQFVIETKETLEAQEAYSQMIGSLERILGTERFADQATLGMQATLERLFKKEGMMRSTLVISKSFDSRQNVVVYGISAVREKGGSTGGGMTRDALETNLAPLHVLLPADF
jgi:hypothetical protein